MDFMIELLGLQEGWIENRRFIVSNLYKYYI